MQTINIISIDQIREYVDVAQNLEVNYINKHISQAQEMFLPGMIGGALYQQLQDQYPDSFSYANINLIQKVWPVIAFRFYQSYLVHDGIYSTPTGLQTYSKDYSNGISDQQRNNLLKYAQERAEWYEQELKYFLEQNKADYPLYDATCLPEVKNTFGISAIQRNKRRGDIPPLGTGRTLRKNY